MRAPRLLSIRLAAGLGLVAVLPADARAVDLMQCGLAAAPTQRRL